MNQPNLSVCPHLGMSGERTVVRTEPDHTHRCFAQEPAGKPDLGHQAAFCLSPGHTSCPIFAQYSEPDAEITEEEEESSQASHQALSPLARLALLAVPAAILIGLAIFFLPDTAPAPAPATNAIGQPTSASPAPTAVAGAVNQQQPISAVTIVRPDTVTPVAGGQVLSLPPVQAENGWWTSSESEGGHIADSYLYAGFYDGNAFVSAMRFDLEEAERGALITDGTLRLTGLQADRFDPGAGGTWTVQLIPGDALPPLRQLDFRTVFNAPAAVTLFPTLYPADLGVGQVNIFTLDASARAWLQDQILRGQTDIVARISGPGGGESLFAWDSGDGPATAGEAPQLILAFEAPPPTAPPLPTDVYIVATSTATPENILTVAAYAVVATDAALSGAPFTPQAIPIYTPTPYPENMATVQAIRRLAGWPPYVVYTATPANAATVTADAQQATAIAMTTGTFTPVPPDAVTPIVVDPTPMPMNVATAAAQKAAATADALAIGTATPLPPDVLLATLTPTRVIITRTPTPENQQTAAANVLIATAVAATTGTFTPFPPNAVTATPTPLPTSTPAASLLVFLDQITPDPTPAESDMPGQLRGKILFISDRDGERRTLAVDPANGRQAFLSVPWPYRLAERTQLASPDGRYSLTVDFDDNGKNQIFSRDNVTGARVKLTNFRTGAFEPAWSPRGNRIAFGSWESGNEEIYSMDPDGSDVVQLTSHGDIDRHPTWSPDGARIAFWSQRDTGRRQLWVMNADGGNPRRVISTAYDDYDPFWAR